MFWRQARRALGQTVWKKPSTRQWCNFRAALPHGIPAASAPGVLDRMLAASDSALRDSCYEAAMLLEPKRRRA